MTFRSRGRHSRVRGGQYFVHLRCPACNESCGEIEVKWYSDPGISYGPPERCYPPEGETTWDHRELPEGRCTCGWWLDTPDSVASFERQIDESEQVDEYEPDWDYPEHDDGIN